MTAHLLGAYLTGCAVGVLVALIAALFLLARPTEPPRPPGDDDTTRTWTA